jgi:hypothetical protein
MGALAIVGTDTRREAGKRLRAFTEDRMAARGIASLVELAELAPVSYDTLHAWFRGRAPTPGAGGRVSQVLGVSYAQMLAAYEGRDVTPTVDVMAELTDLMRELLGELRQSRPRPQVLPEDEARVGQALDSVESRSSRRRPGRPGDTGG